jgi:hypothetical protein
MLTMTPVPELFDDGTGQGRTAVDIWGVLPKMYDSAPNWVAEAISRGQEVWSYNALVQDGYSPKWQIDYAPINFRIQPGFINYSLGLTGLLYWRVDSWTDAPWDDVQTFTMDGVSYPGDGMLVYPGAQAGLRGVTPSLRLKWLREGVEDYEYFQLLQARGQGELALRLARQVGADWSSWERDPAELERVRRELGAAIETAHYPAAREGRAAERPLPS